MGLVGRAGGWRGIGQEMGRRQPARIRAKIPTLLIGANHENLRPIIKGAPSRQGLAIYGRYTDQSGTAAASSTVICRGTSTRGVWGSLLLTHSVPV